MSFNITEGFPSINQVNFNDIDYESRESEADDMSCSRSIMSSKKVKVKKLSLFGQQFKGIKNENEEYGNELGNLKIP